MSPDEEGPLEKVVTILLGLALFLVHVFLAVVGMIVSVVATVLAVVLILAPFVWVWRWLFG